MYGRRAATDRPRAFGENARPWKTTRKSPARGPDFIRQIVADEVAAGKNGGRVQHALSARAERLFAHRPREGDLPQLRRCRGVRRNLLPALRRHEPGQRRTQSSSTRIKNDVRWLGFDWQRPLRLRVRLLPADLRVRRSSSSRKGSPTSTPDRRADPRVSRHAHRARQKQPVPRPPGRGEPAPVRADAARATSTKASACCARRSTWRRRTSTCATRRSTASATPRISARATSGASTRCTTTRTRCPTRSKASTHSLCSLEFEDHRPLYDWFLDKPLARLEPSAADRVRALNLMFTVMSKRLLQAARRRQARRRAGTIRGCRRSRASAGAATRPSRSATSCERIGVTKKQKAAELGLLEDCIRDDLNEVAPRRVGVLDPLSS